MTLLLLAGTGEARQIASGLVNEVPMVASLAGATRQPEGLGVPTRQGGFGGAAAFAAYLNRERIRAVLDATHPFAQRISARSARVCADLAIPYAQVLRPGWEPGAGDRWTQLETEADAALVIPPGATVFLATGRQTLDAFANLDGRRIFCRQIDPPDGAFPFPDGGFIVGRPPFSVADEMALFQKLGIDWLVVKNAGGAASRTKLDAARQLGIQVAMIARPPKPRGTTLETVEAALAWVRSLKW